MTQTISRTYSSYDNAADAVAELKSTGFSEDTINLVAPAHPTDTPDEQLVASISQGGVVKAFGPVYADALRRGETLVSVRAAFGCAATVSSILDRFGPTETGLDDPGYEHLPYDPAAPFSSTWEWKILSDNPTPFSSWLGWPTLLTGRSAPKSPRKLVHDPAPFSKMLGLRMLSDRAAALSTRLGWRLLVDNAAPLSTRFGWPVLSGGQKIARTRFGVPLLSNNPAPLSTRFGLKLLSSNPAPLSTVLGWRALSPNAAKKHDAPR